MINRQHTNVLNVFNVSLHGHPVQLMCSEPLPPQLDAVCWEPAQGCSMVPNPPCSAHGAPESLAGEGPRWFHILCPSPLFIPAEWAEPPGFGRAARGQTWGRAWGLPGAPTTARAPLSRRCRCDGPQVSGLSWVSGPVVSLELRMFVPAWFWDSCDVFLTS